MSTSDAISPADAGSATARAHGRRATAAPVRAACAADCRPGCQLVLLAALLGLWEFATASNKRLNAFLFGSPSAIGGFLVQDVAGRQPRATTPG